ncbi:phospholipase D family protein [Clostridium frigoris]|uniref:phospholipase D n=1 Tax=Clostridium frigoris TaxID=205327 RepID=A0ABS6BW58_9CLOT|nr:phospholipase D-like domain-containing protein [Clostridium frigoris]MBU3161146.1 phospholipase D family protein [Clostridium frigoris]
MGLIGILFGMRKKSKNKTYLEMQEKSVIQDEYDEIKSDVIWEGHHVITSSKPASLPATYIKYYFTRVTGDLDKQMIKVIDTSVDTLDIAIYTITLPNVVDAIISSKKRGVIVRILTDSKTCVYASVGEQLNRLKLLGIPVKINTHYGYMHLKVTIADSKIITTGSYNYTGSATNNHDENLVIISNEKIAKDYRHEFNIMWNDTYNYENYVG